MPICEVAIGIAYTLGECNALLMCSVLHEIPHLHISFILFSTESKQGLSTRVSPKQALADQGITSEGHSLTERDLWVQKEKEFLAAIMLEHGIE